MLRLELQKDGSLKWRGCSVLFSMFSSDTARLGQCIVRCSNKIIWRDEQAIRFANVWFRIGASM